MKTIQIFPLRALRLGERTLFSLCLRTSVATNLFAGQARFPLLRRAGRVDRLAKGAPGNAWDELLQLCLLMAGVQLFRPVAVVS